MRRWWRSLLIRLGVIRLYAIDYGGETDWVSAYSEQEALTWWRNFQREAAGQEWLDEVEAEYLEVVRDRRLETPIGGDAPLGLTFRLAMVESVPPAFIATSVF